MENVNDQRRRELQRIEEESLEFEANEMSDEVQEVSVPEERGMEGSAEESDLELPVLTEEDHKNRAPAQTPFKFNQRSYSADVEMVEHVAQYDAVLNSAARILEQKRGEFSKRNNNFVIILYRDRNLITNKYKVTSTMGDN